MQGREFANECGLFAGVVFRLGPGFGDEHEFCPRKAKPGGNGAGIAAVGPVVDMMSVHVMPRCAAGKTTAAVAPLQCAADGWWNTARAAADARARAEAQAAEQARLEAELSKRRRAELDRLAGEARAQAAADLKVLAPVLAGEVSAEMRPVLEAYVQQYGDVKVRFDGVEETVEVPERAKVTAVLGRPTAGKMGYAMVRIQPGTFTMGSPASETGHFQDETQHEVTLTRGFAMGVVPVTQALPMSHRAKQAALKA